MCCYSKLPFVLWLWLTKLVVATGSLLEHQNANTELVRDVAIIGGGASGAYAASRLRERGCSVAVVEREGTLGGHSQTFTDADSEQAIEYGVVFFHDNRITRKFMSRYGIEPYKNSITDPRSHPIKFYDLQTGNATNFEPPDLESIQAAFAKYTNILEANYSYLEYGYNLPDPVPEELLMPFLEFVQKHGLEDMLNLAFQMGQGYGDFLHEPTLYAMKILSHDILKQVQQGSLLRMLNNSELYGRVARELDEAGDLFLNSTVVRSDRNSDEDGLISLTVDTPSGNIQIRTRQIISTVPPMVDVLSTIFSLDDEERSIFSEFKSNWYWAGVLRNAPLPSFEVQNVHLSNPGGVPTLPGMYVFEATEAPNIHTFWYGAAAADSNQTKERVRHDVLDTIARLQVAEGSAKMAPAVEFLAMRNFSPFACMVDATSIRKGFYRKLYDLQGRRNTWWTGAAWHTHDSSKLWEFTESLLEHIIEAVNQKKAFSSARTDL